MIKIKISNAVRALLPLTFAFFCIHIILRILLLFRKDAFGIPFVNKPDWYIFHAVTWDYMWLMLLFVIWAFISCFVEKYFSFKKSKIAFIVFNSILVLLTYIDHETMRFLGSHISFALLDTYKDPASVAMFWDYFKYDQSIPFLQVLVVLLTPPAIYFLNKIFSGYINKKRSLRNIYLTCIIFGLCCYLFTNVIWTGNSREKKLTPMVNLIYKEFTALLKDNRIKELSKEEILEYQNFWKSIEENDNVIFSKEEPLWKEPIDSTDNSIDNTVYNIIDKDSLLEKPNFIVVFLESHRYMDVKKSSPFLDSLMGAGLNFNRMQASGVPTIAGLLSSHTGIPVHSTITQVMELPFITIPSFASYLQDAGYRTDYFSAADPAWDNLGVWMKKWYDKQHYHRTLEDDSLFWKAAGVFVKDSLAKQSKPFLATFTTRSNHYPFNFAANMPKAEKEKSIQERVIYTMNFADRQLSHFIYSIQNEPWFENTYIIVTADHGFPLGENGVSTIGGGAYYSATHLPFVIVGKNIIQKTVSTSASQIDIAPTILDLAGIKRANPFMGHSLLKKHKDFSLGVHGYKTLNYGNFRLIYKEGEESLLFEKDDTLQTKNVAEENKETTLKMEKIVNMLVRTSDFALENNKVVPISK